MPPPLPASSGPRRRRGTPPAHLRAARGHGRDTTGVPSPPPCGSLGPAPRSSHEGQGHAPAPPPARRDPRAGASPGAAGRDGRAFGGHGVLPKEAPLRTRCCPAAGGEICLFRPQKIPPGSSPVKRGWGERPRDSQGFLSPLTESSVGRPCFPQTTGRVGVRGGSSAWESSCWGVLKRGARGAGYSACHSRVPQGGQGARRAPLGRAVELNPTGGLSAGKSAGKREPVD